MRRRRRINLILGSAALVAVAFGGIVWRAATVRAELKRLVQHLHTDDPHARLETAEQMIALDGRRTDARLAAAASMNALGRFGGARQTIELLIERSDADVRLQAVELYLDSCLSEAAELTMNVQLHTMDMTVSRVDALLERATGLLAEMSGSAATILEARQEDCRAALLHLQLDREEQELAKVRAADAERHEQITGMGASDVASRFRASQDRLAGLCEMALTDPKTAPMARLLQMRAAMRDRKYTDVRAAARAIASLPGLTRTVAGEAADMIVNMESIAAQLVTEDDLALAQAILNHRGVTGAATLRFDLAAASLALQQRRLEAARDRARAVIRHYPGHPAATTLLAQVFILENRPDQALRLLLPLNDRVRSANGKYVEAQARIASGNPSRGLELLREALDLDFNHLPSRLLFAETVAASGQIMSAARDISAAADINPDHPRVMALHARLIIEQEDHAELAQRLISYFDTHRPTAADARIGASMALDHVKAVRALTQAESTELMMLLGSAWCSAEPRARIEVATIVVQVLRNRLDDDPLLWPDPTLPEVLRHRSNPGSAVSDLAGNRFVPSPSEVAAELVEVAAEHWPGEADWQVLLQALRIAKSDVQNKAWTAKQIAAYLAAHPWSDGPLLAAMRHHVQAGRAEDAQQLLEAARTVNPKLALLTQCRYHLEIGQVSNALHDATMIMRGEATGSSVRILGAELGARANLANGSAELAVGLIENLALSAPCGPIEMKIAAADVLMWAHRDAEAAAALISMFSDPKLAPRWLDRILVRAATLLGAQRLDEVINQRVESVGSTALLCVYKAWCLAQRDDLSGARQQINAALKDRPESPRILMFSAALCLAEGRPDAAITIYRQLLLRDGRTAAAAQRELDRLTRSAARRSDP